MEPHNLDKRTLCTSTSVSQDSLTGNVYEYVRITGQSDRKCVWVRLYHRTVWQEMCMSTSVSQDSLIGNVYEYVRITGQSDRKCVWVRLYNRTVWLEMCM